MTMASQRGKAKLSAGAKPTDNQDNQLSVEMAAAGTPSLLPAILNVYWDTRLVGILLNQTPLTFSYHAQWLSDPQAKPLCPLIPFGQEMQATPAVHAFFENLLPEGDQRTLLTRKYQVTSVFGLLAMVGGDTAGSIVLLPPDQAPQPPQYESMTWDDVARLLHANMEPAGIDDDTKATDPHRFRMSISGAQNKLLLSLDDNGQPLRPVGTTPSGFIVKPDIVRSDLKLFGTAINETIVMRAAALCGLPAAQVQYQPTAQACLVRRYDRIERQDGSLKRLWQADLCQLAGKDSTRKYEADGGPSFRQCYELVKAYSVAPAADLRLLLHWLFFNLYVGNYDSHAKNLSMLATDNGLRLAPFYDLMSTRVYSGLANNFAFRIGGTFEPGRMTALHLDAFAREINVNKGYLATVARDVAARVLEAIPKATAELKPGLGYNTVMADRIEQTICSIAKKTGARLAGIAEEAGPA